MAACMVMIGVSAQSYGPMNGAKTATNTDTIRLTIPGVKLTGNVPQLSFQVNALKVSGTPSCILYLQYSNDSLNWVRPTSLDSCIIGNVTPAQTFILTPGVRKARFYRLFGTTSGTQSFTVSGLWYGVRQNE